MSRSMKKYRENLARTPKLLLLSQHPKIKLDLRGLMLYAQNKSEKVVDLTREEKAVFRKF